MVVRSGERRRERMKRLARLGSPLRLENSAARSRLPSPPRTMTSSAPSAAAALAGTSCTSGELNSPARVRTAIPAVVSRSATNRALRSALSFPVCAVTSTVRCPTSWVPP